jgi:hypothetical protein
MGGDRTCPDDCPLAVWTGLDPDDRKVQRKAIAERLYKQRFTMEQIAKQLSVSEATIHRDLNSFTVKELKPAKTASNPRGAGRPKGSTKTRNKMVDRSKLAVEVLPGVAFGYASATRMARWPAPH